MGVCRVCQGNFRGFLFWYYFYFSFYLPVLTYGISSTRPPTRSCSPFSPAWSPPSPMCNRVTRYPFPLPPSLSPEIGSASPFPFSLPTFRPPASPFPPSMIPPCESLVSYPFPFSYLYYFPFPFPGISPFPLPLSPWQQLTNPPIMREHLFDSYLILRY